MRRCMHVNICDIDVLEEDWDFREQFILYFYLSMRYTGPGLFNAVRAMY